MTQATPKTIATADHLYRRAGRIVDLGEGAEAARRGAVGRLHREIFERATEADRLNFSTTFARISYVAHKYALEHNLVFQERRFRRGESDWRVGLRLALELIRGIFEQPVPDGLEEWLAVPYPTPYRAPEVRQKFYQLRVLVVDINHIEELITVRDERRAERTYFLPFREPELTESLCADALKVITHISGPYVVLNLLRAEVRDGNRIYPTQIVVEPDFLVNVTDVASAFSARGKHQAWTSLAKRMLPFEARLPLVRGNIVNSFLDEVIHDPEVTFGALKRRIFAMQPLQLCTFEDAQVRDLLEQLKHHFLTLKKFVREEMPRIGIERDAVELEPSFMSPSYGLKGRLDLLLRGGAEDSTFIVELKTGKIFMPNKHDIGTANFIQTVLYDLMINAALGKEANVRSYILYSVDYDKPLRYAPPEFVRQMEALSARNQLVGIDLMLGNLGADAGAGLLEPAERIFRGLNPDRFGNLASFSRRDHEVVLKVWAGLNELEKKYLAAFLGFTAREHRLSMIGEQRLEHVNGLASLWLDARADKVERFELLDGMTFERYDVEDNLLALRLNTDKERLAKFRQGDIVVLYTTRDEAAQPRDTIGGQVIKCTLVGLTAKRLLLRPRNAQLNDATFQRGEFWSIEKDVLDSSFRTHYNGLFTWAQSSQQLRQRWLGQAPPAQLPPHPDRVSDELTDEQDATLRRIITAPDYFLLWGPPGTGKTSRMLHHLVRFLLENTEENLLLTAYTNRAVDEICESIEAIFYDGEPFRDYIRIGSRQGTAPRFAERLLQTRSQAATSRRELVEDIQRTRIFVGTVASIGGKHELFQLKSFDRVIVDEASQILEPLLAGILPRAPRCLLIGDHRQLPAVVQQSPATSHVYDLKLRQAGFRTLATSLFERLYLTAQRRGWDWAYDRLRHQGRMHRDIMAFPALHFYQGELQILPESIGHHATQLAPLKLSGRTDLEKRVATQRLLFLPSQADLDTPDPKVNRYEADLLVELIAAFQSLYAATDRPIQAGDIGVITPYRAQIAHVRRRLAEAGHRPDDFSVDTVERYQGGAKRIILLSVCANEAAQLASLSQLTEEGVDRKLNVAMTRAREHLVVIGCAEVLAESEVYGLLMEAAAVTILTP